MGEQPRKNIFSRTKIVVEAEYADDRPTRQVTSRSSSPQRGAAECMNDLGTHERTPREMSPPAEGRRAVAGPSGIPSRPRSAGPRETGLHCSPSPRSASVASPHVTSKQLPKLTTEELESIPVFAFLRRMQEECQRVKEKLKAEVPAAQRSRPTSPTGAACAQSEPCTPPRDQRPRRPPGRRGGRVYETGIRLPRDRDSSPVGTGARYPPRRICPDEDPPPCPPLPAPPVPWNQPPPKPGKRTRILPPTPPSMPTSQPEPYAKPPPPPVDRPKKRSFAWECDRLMALWGGQFTSPQSIGGRSSPQSAPSLPSSPGSGRYWETTSEEGFQSGGSDCASSAWSRGTSPPLSSLESGWSTPIITPGEMSPAPEMYPSAFHATNTHVVMPNFQTFLLIIDYIANSFCEDRRQRLNQINCLVKQLRCQQGNELQDSLLTLRDLIIRRGRMLPDLHEYFKALIAELKDIHRAATDRCNPVPNLHNLCELANKQLDPSLSQNTYLKIINDLRLFADWTSLCIFRETNANNQLQNQVEDLLCCPEKVREFELQFEEEFELSNVSIDTVLKNLRRSQCEIDKFLKHWKEGGDVLNQPCPDESTRRYIELPDLDTPELEAGIAPGGPVIGTGAQPKPPGPPPCAPGHAQNPSGPCPSRPQSSCQPSSRPRHQRSGSPQGPGPQCQRPPQERGPQRSGSPRGPGPQCQRPPQERGPQRSGSPRGPGPQCQRPPQERGPQRSGSPRGPGPQCQRPPQERGPQRSGSPRGPGRQCSRSPQERGHQRSRSPQVPGPQCSRSPPDPCYPSAGPSGAPSAWDAPGPSGLQSGRFAHVPVPGPGMRAAYTSSSSDSSPISPDYQRFAPADPRLVQHVVASFSQMSLYSRTEKRNPNAGRERCRSPTSPD